MNLVTLWRAALARGRAMHARIDATLSRRLVDNWRDVLKLSWTVRLVILAMALSGCEVALPIIDQWIIIPRGIFATLSGLTSMAATGARILVQARLSGLQQTPSTEDTHDQP